MKERKGAVSSLKQVETGDAVRVEVCSGSTFGLGAVV